MIHFTIIDIMYYILILFVINFVRALRLLNWNSFIIALVVLIFLIITLFSGRIFNDYDYTSLFQKWIQVYALIDQVLRLSLHLQRVICLDILMKSNFKSTIADLLTIPVSTVAQFILPMKLRESETLADSTNAAKMVKLYFQANAK